MAGGGPIYAVVHPFEDVDIILLGHHGKINLLQVIDLNHWVIVLMLVVLSILLFRFFESRRL